MSWVAEVSKVVDQDRVWLQRWLVVSPVLPMETSRRCSAILHLSASRLLTATGLTSAARAMDLARWLLVPHVYSFFFKSPVPFGSISVPLPFSRNWRRESTRPTSVNRVGSSVVDSWSGTIFVYYPLSLYLKWFLVRGSVWEEPRGCAMALAAEPRRPCTVASGGDRVIGSSGGSYFRRLRTASLIILGIVLLTRVATVAAIKGIGMILLSHSNLNYTLFLALIFQKADILICKSRHLI